MIPPEAVGTSGSLLSIIADLVDRLLPKDKYNTKIRSKLK